MAVIYNTNIVRDGLLCYIDINNKRCYTGDGTTSRNLTNSKEVLSSSFISNYTSTKNKNFLSNDASKRWVINFEQGRNLQDVTIQFWANFSKYSFDGSSFEPFILNTNSISAVAEYNEITYNDDSLEYNGQLLTLATLPMPVSSSSNFNLILNGRGQIGYFCQVFSPETMVANSINLTGNKWALYTFTKRFSTISFYRNKEKEERYLSSSFGDRTVPLSGIVSNNINMDINHITVYNRALTDLEVVQNYNAFKNRYESEPYIPAFT